MGTPASLAERSPAITACVAPGADRARSSEGERGLRARWLPRSPDAPPDGSLLDRILTIRGVSTPDERDGFLHPSLMQLHDPSRLPGVDRAAARILDAARRNEPIVVFGDYDVDGVCASAILYHMIRALAPGAIVKTYVPHRIDEGYGLNPSAITDLANDGARVIISVDCGITATESALAARAANVDLIITDHHTPPGGDARLPDAFAIVHPRLPGPAGTYPFGELCGAGVAFKLAWRLATMAADSERVHDDQRSLLLELLGLAGLATVADIVPLVGENRIIARFGLPRVKHTRLEGLRALVVASRLDGERIDETAAGFSLGPRLNAAGRLGHAAEVVELLTTADGARAREIATGLDRANTKRQGVQRRIVEQATAMVIERGLDRPGSLSIVLADPKWHAGVVGIACSHLVERFARPTILMHVADGVCRGSGRSIEGFDLHRALSRCDEHLEAFGGHAMAAGLRVSSERLPAFTDAFETIASGSLTDADLVATIRYDAMAGGDELSIEAIRALDGLAPFGRENPPVHLLLRGLRVCEAPIAFGAGGSHLKLGVSHAGRVVRMVGWKMAMYKDAIPAGAGIDAIVRPKISSWNGRVEPEIIDIKPHGPTTRA